MSLAASRTPSQPDSQRNLNSPVAARETCTCRQKFPCAVDKSVPSNSSRRDGNTVLCCAVAPAELNSYGTVGVFLRGRAVDVVGVLLVLMEISVRSVNTDRPEAVNGNIAFDREFVNGLSIVLGRHDGQIEGVFGSVAAPTCGAQDQMPDRSTLPRGPNIPVVSVRVPATPRRLRP